MPASDDRSAREPVFAASTVRLFGRLVDGLTIDVVAAKGSAGPSAQPSAAGEGEASPGQGESTAEPKAELAQIYGFSFEGHYRELDRPTIFQVHGPGDEVNDSVSRTGVATEPPEFAEGLRVWQVDRDDITVRIDLDRGTVERLLLDPEAGIDGPRYGAGHVRLRGGHVGLQGGHADLRLGHVALRGGHAGLRGGRGGGLSD